MVPADMVCIAVGVVDSCQTPSVGVQDLPDFPPRVLVATSVNEADVVACQPHQPDLRWALDIIASLRDLHQLVHGCCFPFRAGHRPSLLDCIFI